MWTPNNNIAVTIGGKPLFSFKSLKLHQPVNGHHRFELTLDNEVAAEALKLGTEWLGKRMQAWCEGARTAMFNGVVTKVNVVRTNLDSGHVRVSGFSTTYLLENAPGYHSWLGRTLGEIVAVLCKKAGVPAQVSPEHGKPVGYACQYGESDFTFIRRLAWKYQEWLYHDGTRLVFGKPRDMEPVRLEFDTTLTSFETGVQTLARPAKVFSYQSSHDHTMAEGTPNEPTGQDLLGRKAFEASMAMFREPALQHALPRVPFMKEMERYVKKKQEAEAAESHYMVGTSGDAQLKVGSVVRITSPFGKRIDDLGKASLGEFLITEIEHTVGEGRYYSNRFKAIPSGVGSLPPPDVSPAVAETQMAKVVGNADPRGMGRVQVQMNWQEGGMHTDWVRVMTPDGGGSGDVETNRGMVFIPEVGDHVLVGFRHGDPDRPYVMGSLFNGRTGKGGGEGNNTKSITTRSGCALTLNDAEGSVTLHDKGDNGNSSVEMKLDGAGNHSINAKTGSCTSVGADASVLQMNKDGKINLSGNKSVTITVGKGGSEVNVSEEDESFIKLKIGSSSIEMKDGTIEIKSPKVIIKGGKGTITASDNIDLLGSSDVIIN